MKKEYIKPILKVAIVANQDMICLSAKVGPATGGEVLGNSRSDNDWDDDDEDLW